jgi:hypothetical protein
MKAHSIPFLIVVQIIGITPLSCFLGNKKGLEEHASGQSKLSLKNPNPTDYRVEKKNCQGIILIYFAKFQP